MNKILDANQNGDITICKAELDLSNNCYDFDKVEMETYNIFDLINQLKQCREVIDEAINHLDCFISDTGLSKYDTLKILMYTKKVLQKYKGDNK